MEKQYIWYDTAWGCLTALIGLVVASILAVVARLYAWRSPWIYYTVGAFGYFGAFCLGGWVDWKMRKREVLEDEDEAIP